MVIRFFLIGPLVTVQRHEQLFLCSVHMCSVCCSFYMLLIVVAVFLLVQRPVAAVQVQVV